MLQRLSYSIVVDRPQEWCAMLDERNWKSLQVQSISDHSVRVHPTVRDWCRQSKLVSFDDFWSIPGIVISGHVDRHVMRVEIGELNQPKSCILKREHRIPWSIRFQNWREGFGLVGKSVREAKTLEMVASLGMPVSKLIASGENQTGKSFLLLESKSGSIDLRHWLQLQPNRNERFQMAKKIGRILAHFSLLGVVNRDLSAKHLLIDSVGAITIIDWQRVRLNQRITTRLESQILARLLATIPSRLLDRRSLVTAWKAYRTERQLSKSEAKRLLDQTKNNLAILAQKKSSRLQVEEALDRTKHELIWLEDDERFCVVPEWSDTFCSTSFRQKMQTGKTAEVLHINGRRLQIKRLHSQRSLIAVRRFRSPLLSEVRELFEKQQRGVDAPRVIAFGQNRENRTAFMITVDESNHANTLISRAA
jgi:tRNA A-37 threonylcarbamoyl transferase component Bud32